MLKKNYRTIWGNCLVKNEDKFLWFAVSSVIEYLDKLLIWDTGSTDNTVEIIKLLQKKYLKKIEFKECGEVDEYQFSKVRQEMLSVTKSDWLLVLDGDEVWWDQSIKLLKEEIDKNGDKLYGLVTPFKNAIGDVYHIQSESAGQYHLLGQKGHLSIRAFNRKIPGLHVNNPYGREGYFGESNIPIQDIDENKLLFLNAPFLHLSNLSRSTSNTFVMQRKKKYKYELGYHLSEYPQVFSRYYPDVVASPFVKRSAGYLLRAMIETPLKIIKRKANG